MSFCLPVRDFRYMSEEELRSFDINNIKDEPGPGYIFEVTLHYPKSLHLAHNSYPVAPLHMEITEDDLSPYARKCWKVLGRGKKYKSKKLTSHFRDRVRYWCHGMNLRLYLELGLELVDIHTGVTFYQEAFIKSFVQTCTDKRKEAHTKSEGDMFKLLANSTYGKKKKSDHITYPR